MMRLSFVKTLPFLAAVPVALAAQPGFAAPPPAPASEAPAPAAPAPGSDSIVLYFDSGSATIRPDEDALLDKAARTYREGHPILMTVSAGTDGTGPARLNMRLSAARALNVYRGLVERGIPADRFQILAKGETDPVVDASGASQQNRRATITWK